MQQNITVEADTHSRTSVNVNPNHFRSTHNYENMKKIIRKRTDNVPDNNPHAMDSPESSPQEEVQPPLPLEPPPPDEVPVIKYNSSPEQDYDFKPLYLVTPKQERSSPEVEEKCVIPPEYVVPDDPMPVTEEPKPLNPKPICKDFIRGNCSRVGCKYRHEIDLAQLRGIFIFCHNFQNGVCFKTSCKYVHADCFEEQKFYRTGELPKVLKQKPQPPVLPPTSDEEEKNKDQNSFTVNTTKPPPNFIPKLDQQVVSGTFNQNLNMEPKSPKSASKRSWSDTEEGLSELFNCTSPQEESRAKHTNDSRCGSCKVMENRLRFAVDRLKDIMKSAADSEVKMIKLERKHKFLLQVASTVTLARLNERDNINLNQPTDSIFSQIDLQQALQQSSAMTEQLAHYKKVSSQQATNLATQLKHFIQGPSLGTSEHNASKAFPISTQQLLQPTPSSNSQYQLQTSPVNTIPNDQNRLGNMVGSSRQLSNLLNGW